MNRMPCHISDGAQTPEDVQYDHPEREMDERDRDDWINERDEGICTDPNELKEIESETHDPFNENES